MPLRSVAQCLKESRLGHWALSDEPCFKIARQLLEDTELPPRADRGGPPLHGRARLRVFRRCQAAHSANGAEKSLLTTALEPPRWTLENPGSVQVEIPS